jgi:fumarate hydratase subunit beta
MQARALELPLTAALAATLRAGETVELNGELLTARDAAHRRLTTALRTGTPLPVSLTDATLYYTGPTPAPPGEIIGAAGPTTASRMDVYTEPLLAAGVRVLIGKGERGAAVAAALQRYSAVYLAAIGGAGAYLSTRITACRVLAYADLGTEAIYVMRVKAFPAIVAQDAHGGNVYRRSDA